MKLWVPSLVLLGLGLLPSARANKQADTIASLPDCAVTCLLPSIRESACEATDQKCICGDASLQDEVTACVKSSCTVKESLTTKNVTQTACGAPIRDQSKHLNVLIVTVEILAAATVIFRLAFKLWTRHKLFLDDWFIFATSLTSATTTALTIYGTIANGLGRDVWTLSVDTIMNFGFYFFILVVIYFLEVALLKMSILFFYLSIFPGVMTRRILWATLTFNALFGAAYVLTVIFQCSPISFNWTKWDKEHKGSCVNITAVAWSNAIVSIVFDIWMLAVPMSQLRKLKLHWKRKVGVAIMFIVGTFVTIVSILRLRSLVSFAKSGGNATWGYSDVLKWSVVEIRIGTICACMPTIRLALVRCSNVFRETTTSYSNQRKSYGRKSYGKNVYHRQESMLTEGNTSHAVTTGDGEPGVVPRDGVVCQKSFAVEYAHEDDTHLVPMSNFAVSGGSSARSEGSSVSL